MLFALFFRPVGFDYRSKIADPRWRTAWDWGLFAGGAVPALVFGVAFGNLLLGVPLQYDEVLRPSYSGSFFALLTPFALLTGVVSLAMLVMHGAVFLQMKTEEVIQARAQKATLIFASIYFVAFLVAGIWISYGVDGFRLVSQPEITGTAGLLMKAVTQEPGAWLANYSYYPLMLLAPIAGLLGAIGVIILTLVKRPGLAFLVSTAVLTGTILTAGFSMFPFIMPSSIDPKSSLTLWDATSSHLTLTLMFWAVIIFLPIIIVYTSWVYRVMRGKVTEQQIEDNKHSAY